MLRVAALQLDFIPNVLTSQGSLWVPAEPVLGDDAIPSYPGDSAATVHSLTSHLPNQIGHLLGRLNDLAADPARKALEQSLGWCVERNVDLVVLPEYSVPVGALDVVSRFSSDLAIVGGIGFVRPDDVDALEEFAFDVAIGTSVGFFIHEKQRKLIEKAHPAELEQLTRGRGPQVVEFDVDGTTYRMGVALCLDYIHAGHTFNSSAGELDLVAIPSLSRSTAEFTPKKQRDFVRIVANHAEFGGTGIFVEHLQGPDFVDQDGTRTLEAGSQGVLVVDFDRRPSRRTSTEATQNRLIARAQILIEGEVEQADQVTQGLATIRDPSLLDESIDDVSRWAAAVVDRRAAFLKDSLTSLQSLALRGTLTPEVLSLLADHLVLRGVLPTREIRRRQIEEVIKEIARAPGADDDTQLAKARLELLTAKKALVPTGAALESSTTSESWTLVTAFRLGGFTPEDAARTLESQKAVLAALSASMEQEIGLVYRLSTVPGVSEDVPVARFDVFIATRGADVEVAAQIDADFGHLLRTVFVDGWDVGASDSHLDVDLPLHWHWQPDVTVSSLVDRDWSPVVDLLRTLPAPAQVELACVSANSYKEGKVELRASVKTSTELSSVALGTITSLLVGNAKGSWVPASRGGALTSQVGLVCTPEVALRLFHPPSGHIQSRGLKSRRPLTLPISGIPFPRSGIVLGRGTALSAKYDAPVDARLDLEDRLRHLYLVGKTGSGKTNILKHLIRQDLNAGSGLAVIDPHGGLVDYALRHARPQLENGDLVLLDFGQREFLPVLNPLDLDIGSEADLDLAIEELHDIFVQRISSEHAGPVFEDMFRLSLETITDRLFPLEPSLLLMPHLWRNQEMRRWVIRLFAHGDLGDRWNTYDEIKRQELADHTKWMLAKFADLSNQGVLRAVLGGANSTVSIEDIVYGRKALLVRLPETAIGTKAASFIGSLIVSRIRRALFNPDRTSEVDGPSTEPFFIYIDEFQKFVTGGFDEMFAEARKFRLGVTVAHQNLRQLTAFSVYERSTSDAMLHSILGNVGNMMVMKVGRLDAEVLGRELGLSERELLRIDQYDAVARAVVRGVESEPFTVSNEDAESWVGEPTMSEQAQQAMIDGGVWKSRDELESLYATSVNHIKDLVSGDRSSDADRPTSGGDSFLDDWLKRRRGELADRARIEYLALLKGVRGVGDATATRIAELFPAAEQICSAGSRGLADSVKGVNLELAERVLDAVCSS